MVRSVGIPPSARRRLGAHLALEAASRHVSRSTGSRSRAPTQHLEVAAVRRAAHVPSSHGQPFTRAHFSTSRPPTPRRARRLVPRAAVRAPTSASGAGRPRRGARLPSTGSRSRAPTFEVATLRRDEHVFASHGHLFARVTSAPEVAALRATRAPPRPAASLRARPLHVSRWPPSAARAHVFASHGHLFCAPTSAPEVAVSVAPRTPPSRGKFSVAKPSTPQASPPRRPRTGVWCPMTIPRVHVLHGAQVSLLHGFIFARHHHRTSRRRHRVAHPRDRGNSREICGSDNLSRTCATNRWPGRPGIGAPESESGATGLLAVSGLEVIVGGRACARAGRCGGFDVGART